MPQKAMRNNSRKIDQLTSLRFFAAVMVVIYHMNAENMFGIHADNVNFGQAVSFFFVLSGFILSYVYPKLNGWSDIKRFWLARLARLWPAYIFSFLLGFWMLPYVWNPPIALSYLAMMQSWIPMSKFYYSYNAVGWSISTEFFFYLMFPVLLSGSEKYGIKMFVLSMIVLILIIFFSEYLALPEYGNPRIAHEGYWVTRHALIYIHPVSRMVEFVFGMILSIAFCKGMEANPSSLNGSGYELSAVAVCAASVYYMESISEWCRGSNLGISAALWLQNSGSMFAFGLLIYFIAQGQGIVSKILAHPFLVVLGEISYSLYLVHQVFLYFYKAKIAEFPQLPNLFSFIFFFSLLLLFSYLMWVCIEIPGRRLIVGANKIHASSIMALFLRGQSALNRKILVAGLAFCAIAIALFVAMTNSYTLKIFE